jgi:UDP-N-acetylmuramoyl-tripeptide--D-alanyl-D-alanine ligase
MIAMSLADIAEIGGGTVDAGDPRSTVTGPAFVDSRAVEPGGLFVACRGVNVDGHDYAAVAVEAGAAGVLCARPVGVPSVIVADPVAALGRLARAVVDRLPHCRRIAITGSQGKTSTKDLLAHVLEQAGPTVAPWESFNNEIGVPVTALRATGSTRYLIAEMGARGRGHIRHLTGIVPPDVAVVLNVGVAHLGEFGSRAAIAAAKGELVDALRASGVAVLNADDGYVLEMAGRTAARVITFGRADDASVHVADLSLDDEGHPVFSLVHDGLAAPVTLPLVGEHQALNAAAAAAAALGCGVPLEDSAAALCTATSRSRWRMEVHQRADGVTIVNDAYNANPDSMRAALSALAAMASGRETAPRTWAVLGEMRELGPTSIEEHARVGGLAARLGVSRLVVVGPEAEPIRVGAAREGAPADRLSYVPDGEAALALLRADIRPSDIVLVKASRAAGLELVAERLIADTTVNGAGGGALR